LIVFCRPGVTSGLTVRTRIDVTSRCSNGSAVSANCGSPEAAARGGAGSADGELSPDRSGIPVRFL